MWHSPPKGLAWPCLGRSAEVLLAACPCPAQRPGTDNSCHYDMLIPDVGRAVEPFFCYWFLPAVILRWQPLSQSSAVSSSPLTDWGGNADSPLAYLDGEKSHTPPGRTSTKPVGKTVGSQRSASQPDAMLDGSKRSNTTPPPVLPHRQLLAQTSSLRTPVPGLLTLVCSWIPPRVLNLPA